MFSVLTGKIGSLGESPPAPDLGVSTDGFSVGRDPRILFLGAGRALFGGSRYLPCKNDKLGEGQRKSGDLKMLFRRIALNRSGGSVKGKGYTEAVPFNLKCLRQQPRFFKR